MSLRPAPGGQWYKNTAVIFTLFFLRLKFLVLPPRAYIIKLSTMVIYCHSTVISKVIYLYNTERWYYHGMVVNYCGKQFKMFAPGLLTSQ
jgi:hypothetical protein